jgi:hypothetical protein
VKKIENMKKVKEMLHKADLNGFEEGYCRYFGCGTHLYIFADNCDDKIKEVGDQQIHPSKMAKQLSEVTDNFRVVMIDVEIGGTSVWPEDKRND